MECTWPESVSLNRQRVMEELVQGREMANQLQGVLIGDVRSAEVLTTKILGSFTNTLLILNGSEDQQVKEELTSQVQASTSNTIVVTASGSGSAIAGADSSSWDVNHDDAMKSEEYRNEEICNTETFKDRRGSYKRSRKTSHSWTKDDLDLVDDGHAWRKYGQKMILSTKHPRNYFRCTHKFDQGCKATKHVQKIQDEPQLFRTTYYGNHTCTDYRRAPHELILDCSSREESSQNIIRFDDIDTNNVKEEHPFFSAFTSIKKESAKEEEMMIKSVSDHDQVTHHNESPSSCDYLMSPVLGVFESSTGPISGFSSPIASDYDAMISSLMVGNFHYFDDEVDFPYKF